MTDFDITREPTLDQSDDKTHPKLWSWCFWTFFLILIPLLSVILTGFSLFDSSTTAFNEKGRIADILLVITYVITICGIMKVIFSIANSISLDHSTSVHMKKHSNIVLAFLFILGVGDSLFIMTRFGDQLILIINQSYAANSQCLVNLALSMAANFLKSLCQLCILMFILHQLNQPIKFKKQESKIFLTCLAIFCLIQWAQILLQEVHYHKNRPDSCATVGNSSLKRFDEVTPYLYPLGLEYRFASFIELVIMSECLGTSKKNVLVKFYHWLNKKISCQSCTVNRKVAVVNSCPRMVLSCFSACSKKIKRPLGRQNILFPAILLPAVGTLLVSLSIVIVLFQEINTDKDPHRTALIHYEKSSLLTLISEICEIVLLLIISLYSIYSLNKICQRDVNPEQVSSVHSVNMEFIVDFAILLISNLFLLIYCCVTAVGSVISKAEERLTQSIRWLTFTASVIPVIQTILQVIIVWRVCRYHGVLNKAINQMWITLCFAIWLFDTFSAKAYDTNEIQISVYSGSWDVLAAVFVPMSLFFRFHSCIMFANIKDGAYWEDEIHNLP